MPKAPRTDAPWAPRPTKCCWASLDAIDRDSNTSQRTISRELNVALGLANGYLKRCVRKGWIKIKQAPRRRYAYYLTPQGFAEKARLTGQYLTASFTFFRRAREQMSALLGECAANRANAHRLRRGFRSRRGRPALCARSPGYTRRHCRCRTRRWDILWAAGLRLARRMRRGRCRDCHEPDQTGSRVQDHANRNRAGPGSRAATVATFVKPKKPARVVIGQAAE